MKTLKSLATTINKKRNAIAHQGEFCNEAEAKEAIGAAKEFIISLVQIYEPNFALKKRGL